jgi:hypothetical protein
VRPGLWFLAAGAVLAGTACTKSSGGPVPPATGPAHVEVTNRYALPVEIYAVGSSITQRLGTVNPGFDAHFVIPAALLSSSVELQARPNTSVAPYRSGPLLLSPGAVVDLVVAAQLFSSTATIRP